MPNTPVAVGRGWFLYHASEQVSPEQVDQFLQLMEKAGGLYPLEESLMDVGPLSPAVVLPMPTWY